MDSKLTYSDKELEALLNADESDLSERKAEFKTSETRKKCKEIVCAFANDLPGHDKAGVLFIGAFDDGTPTGEPVSDELLRNLSAMATDGNIMPLPVMTVNKRKLKGAEMAVVTVAPSDMPPVRYDGRIWVRKGPRRALANAQEERILNEKRRHKHIPFDIHPIPPATIHDLSRSIFETDYLPAAFAADVLEGNGRTYEQRLASCKFITSPNEPIPTFLGLLSIGKTPQDFLPGASIQFLRINGVELTDALLDEARFDGCLRDMLSRAEDKLNVTSRTAVDVVSGPTHKENRDYPQVALQQILYNAVLHRTYEKTHAPIRVYWYNDRIEIISPGGPYGNVTTENFGTPGITDYRNPNICDALKTFGFVQAFGRGIAIAKEAMKKNGNPDLSFDVNQSAVVCMLRAKS